MKRLIILFTILYVVTLASGGYFFFMNKVSNETVAQELATTKSALTGVQNNLEAEQSAQTELQKKITDANTNATFLARALCPTLESTNKEALCVKDNTEWFSQTMLAGTMITDPDTKTKMDALLVSLGAKTKPTAKQLYEMLKPIEVGSLKALTESLK